MGFDWQSFFTALFASGSGAFGAYYFNLKQEEKREKNTEKSQLIQLFYDLNILSKYIYRYNSDAMSIIKDIYNDLMPCNILLPMNFKTINIDDLGFITKKSNKMYEILTHMRMELAAIYEFGIAYNESGMRDKESMIMQLVSICISFPKLITMIHVCLFSINSMLIKYYKSENLIKDNVLKNMASNLKTINNAIVQYNKIIHSNDMICFYTGKPYTQEQKDGEKEDLDYVEYVLNDWVLDFGLDKRYIEVIAKDIDNAVIA